MSEATSSNDNEAAALAREAHAIRNAYLAFWGAHSHADIQQVGVSPTFPETPSLDRWYPRDGSKGRATNQQDGEPR